jgi:hypothetical protein
MVPWLAQRTTRNRRWTSTGTLSAFLLIRDQKVNQVSGRFLVTKCIEHTLSYMKITPSYDLFEFVAD